MGNKNRKKNLRKIVVKGETYFWNVSDYNFVGPGGCNFKIWKNKKQIFYGLIQTDMITPSIVREKILKIEN